MPKEVIYGDATVNPEGELSAVVVHWGREGTVQIVSREAEAEQHGPDDDPIPARYGYYVSLNRAGINGLIKNLRRARDQAFGRDE